MMSNPYQNFEHYVLRSPLLPLTFFKKLTSGETISEDFLREVCSDKVVREALFLASPGLYGQFEKWLEGEMTNKTESDKMVLSVLKYLSRMSSRCTPFGLFAGTALGSFGENTQLELRHYQTFKRHTRIDMNYLVALTQDLVKQPHIKAQIRFSVNNSTYVVGNQLRYIEYHYLNSRRRHQSVALERSEYLDQIMEVSVNGALPAEMAEVLVSDDISRQEAEAFVDQLIDSQFLVSELEPCISGPEFLDQILPILKRLEEVESIVETLEEVACRIGRLDEQLGNEPEEYKAIAELLKSLGTGLDPQFLFQADLSVQPKQNQLGKRVIEKALKGFSALNKMSFNHGESMLTKFGKALYARHEDRLVPIGLALDIEAGIVYGSDSNSGDISVLVDDLVLPPRSTKAIRTVSESPLQNLLRKKLIQAMMENAQSIQLTDADLAHFGANWDDVPETVSALIEVVADDNTEKIMMSAVGGSCAANLLGRFAHGDQQIKEHTERIIEKEQGGKRGEILAEIVHLPESRAGNVIMRPQLRKYEIPYLAKSLADREDQLTIDDLMVQARLDGTIMLISKKHKKAVLPRLTTAHNFSAQTLPVYQFLGDLQTQNTRWIGFRWGNLSSEFDFLPRIEYENVIFCEARWMVPKAELKPLLEAIDHDQQLSEAMEAWKAKRQIPQAFLLLDGDNKLLVNSENLTSTRMFLNEVKNKPSIVISEYLEWSNAIAKQDDQEYSNQVLISFFNAQKLINDEKNDE